jgi:type I restriction enzyme S subunit
LIRAGDLLVARTGATYGKTMLASMDMQAVFASFLIRIRVDRPLLLPQFYWHFAQSSDYWRQARSLVSEGGQPQFNANVLKGIVVPTPDLNHQRRVVEVLDSLDALGSDLAGGLPVEISARRRQYEYYRDRLLTFNELAS